MGKLLEMGLTKLENGDYVLAKEVKVEEMGEFFRIGHLLLPRFTVYAVMFTTLLAYFLFEVRVEGPEGIWASVSLLLGSAITWFETWRAWRRLPQ